MREFRSDECTCRVKENACNLKARLLQDLPPNEAAGGFCHDISDHNDHPVTPESANVPSISVATELCPANAPAEGAGRRLRNGRFRESQVRVNKKPVAKIVNRKPVTQREEGVGKSFRNVLSTEQQTALAAWCVIVWVKPARVEYSDFRVLTNFVVHTGPGLLSSVVTQMYAAELARLKLNYHRSAPALNWKLGKLLHSLPNLANLEIRSVNHGGRDARNRRKNLNLTTVGKITVVHDVYGIVDAEGAKP